MIISSETLLKDYADHGVHRPFPGEDLEAYLRRVDVLDRGFSYDEIVDPRQHDKQRPPTTVRARGRVVEAWANLATVLALANALRERALREVPGLTMLTCNAAYRPSGGASNSAHKEAAALDLNAPAKLPGSVLREWYRCAVRFWCEFATPTEDQDKPGTVPFGIGLYTWAGKVGPVAVRTGYRVHVDACAIAGTRSWQGIRSGFGRPHRIKNRRGINGYYGLPVLLAVEQGLDVPSLRDL